MKTAQKESLFDVEPVGAHRRTDPRSSSEAAAKVDARRQRDQIMRLLGSTTAGWTADELAASMRPEVHRSTVASRLAQLRADGLCEPFGFKPNERGRNVQTWVLRTRGVVSVPVGSRL